MTDLMQKIRSLLNSPLGWGALFLLGIGAGFVLDGDDPAPSKVQDPAVHAHAEDSIYTCSMHPQIRQTEPGQCPICGMDLVTVASSSSGDLSPSEVRLSPRAKALARLQTTAVRRRGDSSSVVRLLGRVEASETAQKSVTVWTSGRIDKLHVNTTGERVRAGQTVATMYSPEIFAAHQDLLVAKNQVAQMATSSEANQAASRAMYDASRERLELLGVPRDEVARMEKQSEPTKQVRIRTPFSGTVLKRVATEGAYVKTGAPLYLVANLKNLWVQLEAYESDLSRLQKGQSVTVSVDALPGEAFAGTVTFIDPQLDNRRRIARVRVEVDNASGKLRPGMFASAQVVQSKAGGKQPLVIPATAPLFTGRRSVVYVEKSGAGDGSTYEARVVRLGPRLDGEYPVVAGLAEGERVVSRGAFALDADLQIRGGHSMMAQPDDTEKGAFDEVVEVSDGERKQLAPILSWYLEVQTALAADDLSQAKGSADAMAKAVRKGASFKRAKAAKAWAKLEDALEGHATHVAMAKDIEGARAGFEQLSLAAQAMIERYGNPLGQEVRLAYCPMAAGSKGAVWLQLGEVIDNSYFGESMKTCGEVKQSIAPGFYLTSGESPAVVAPAAGGHNH